MSKENSKKPKKKKAEKERVNFLDWMYPDPETEEGKKAKRYIPYNDSFDVISQWARSGLKKEEIAVDCIGISLSTFNAWLKKCPRMNDALKKGRAYAHARVENALFVKATGYTIMEKQAVKTRVKEFDGDGKKIGEHEEVQLIDVPKEIPPDMAAIAFYLKNNMPHKYKDKWPDMSDTSDEEAGRMCLKVFAKAVAAAEGGSE